jgi:hypothetical protein
MIERAGRGSNARASLYSLQLWNYGAAEACYGLCGLNLFCAPKSAAARARKHAIKERVCRGAVMTGYVRECRYSIGALAAQARDLTPSPRAQ